MPKGSGNPITKIKVNKKFSIDEKKELLKTLKSRFEENKNRHKGVEWTEVEKKLTKNKIGSIVAMERTGGKPDVVKLGNKLFIIDCSQETPDRRSICYDKEGEDQRKKKGINPGGNAVEIAKDMGIEILNEELYRALQELGEFDLKTSTWLSTPQKIRELGGALFGDRRYDTVFMYHNGAESFYSSRGFRGMLELN